jgi:hypothetical protein
MPRVDIPTKRPADLKALVAPRAQLSEMAFELARGIMKCEFELMNAQDPAALSVTVRKLSELLSTSAATWAGISDSIRHSWNI